MAPTNFRTLAETPLISRALVSGALAVALLLPAGQAAARATLSERICAEARKHLQTLPPQAAFSAFLATTDYRQGRWTRVSSQKFSASTIPDSADSQWLYVAYLRQSWTGDAGALSVRIAAPAENGRPRTNQVELLRPAIRRGVNRCEPRGRRTIDRTVRVNQYIDYHRRDAMNSSLEDFHFAYPTTDRSCTRTDRKEAKESYLFENVERSAGDSFIARNFRFIGPAYGVTHNYGSLRSELHYRAPDRPGLVCAGFRVDLTTIPTEIAVQEHGLYWQWIPHRTNLTVQR